MLGEYLTALLIAVLGYVYHAYLCFKVRLTSVPKVPASSQMIPDFFPPRTQDPDSNSSIRLLGRAS
jgi:hypothetical protein